MKLKGATIILPVVIGVLLISHISQAISYQGTLFENIACVEGTEDCTVCDFVELFVNGANILVGLSGAFAILMFIYGGLVFITAYGNETRIKWGKDILIATVVGIFIVMLAWTLVNVIIEAMFGGSSFSNWSSTNNQCY